jgi:putative endonuclease
MAEWLNAAVLKTVKDVSPSGVRIPVSPQRRTSPQDKRCIKAPLIVLYVLYLHFKKRNNGRHYYGSTSNLETRLKYHNAGKVRSTKAYRLLKLHYYEEYHTDADALKREIFFKSIDGYVWLKERGMT